MRLGAQEDPVFGGQHVHRVLVHLGQQRLFPGLHVHLHHAVAAPRTGDQHPLLGPTQARWRVENGQNPRVTALELHHPQLPGGLVHPPGGATLTDDPARGAESLGQHGDLFAKVEHPSPTPLGHQHPVSGRSQHVGLIQAFGEKRQRPIHHGHHPASTPLSDQEAVGGGQDSARIAQAARERAGVRRLPVGPALLRYPGLLERRVTPGAHTTQRQKAQHGAAHRPASSS